MALDIEKFVRLRPLLTHVTSRRNAALIERQGRLVPAATILREAGMGASVRTRRPEAVVIGAGRNRVYVRDQAPLHPGNVRLAGKWAFADLVEELNEHVFFWPAGRRGPNTYGKRLEDKYAGQDQVVMCFGSENLIRLNLARLRVCACNSGAPRCNPHVGKAERGPATLAKPAAYLGTPGTVIEVAFRGEVKIADSLEWVAPI